MEKKKMKPRGGNSPVIGDNGLMLNEGDASKAAIAMRDTLLYDDMFGELFLSIKCHQDVVDLRSTKPDQSNLETLKRRFVGYIASCIENDQRFGNKMVYLAIGINDQNAYDWEHGRSRGREHSDFIKRIKQICGAYREFLGINGLLNPVTLVWWQKNYDGLVDRQEVILTPNNALGSEPDQKALEDKIVNSVVVED